MLSLALGLLVMRLGVGLLMVVHGAQKLFGMFGGYGLKGTAGFFESLGFKPGVLFVVLAGLAEVLGGLLLAAGLLTPLAGLLIAGTMAVAILTAHKGEKLIGGYELPLVYLVVGLGLALAGPGPWTLMSIL